MPLMDSYKLYVIQKGVISGNEHMCFHFLKLLNMIHNCVVIPMQIKVRNLECSETESLQSELVVVL